MAAEQNEFVVQSVRCARKGCSTVRKDANHWFLLSITDQGKFLSEEWDSIRATGAGAHPACGDACALAMYGMFLQKGTLDGQPR